jgi:hypothetical protein
MPDWTPPDLFEFPEAWDFQAVVHSLFLIFERDFMKSVARFHGLPVVFDDRYDDSVYPEGFWHVITRGKGDRRLDTERARRLPWLKPVVESPDSPKILVWSEKELDRKGQLRDSWFLWYEAGDYLVVLKEKRRQYFLATAFYVFGRNREYYRDKYQKGKKKGTGV